GCGRLHRRRDVPAGLLAGAAGDPAPVLDAPLAALFLELHDAELRIDGRYRAHAELGRLLHDPVHRIGFHERLHEHELERRFRQRLERLAELELRAATAERAHYRDPLGAAAVERNETIAVAEPQHVSQVMRFALAERQAFAAELALEEKSY